ncbi:hypothetical protein [Herminiimonas fonticola]|uniref:hypothetical protein n=1 Tax=Herminiimonas fonticola TaxID=303380 RepID=UPI000DD96A23|nr:hypothetical protein [Herminiimonas fonticola]
MENSFCYVANCFKAAGRLHLNRVYNYALQLAILDGLGLILRRFFHQFFHELLPYKQGKQEHCKSTAVVR